MDNPRSGTTDRTDYFKMLAANRTSVVVALASDDELGRLDPQPNTYFKEGQHEYGDGVVVTSKKTGTRDINGLMVDSYTLTISQPNKETIKVPLLHAKNWQDHSTQSAETLIGLANHVKQVATPKRGLFARNNSPTDPAKGEPVVHCRAGVGRTGTLVAGLAALDNPELSVEEIVTDLRYSRSEMMVQTDEQLRTVEEVAARLGNPVLARADRHGHPAAAAAA
jgi:protein tyrosine phosphatase